MKDILYSCRNGIYPALFFVLLMMFGLSAHAKSSQARILQTIDDHSLIQLKGNTPLFAHPKNDLGVASDSLVLRHVQLLLKRSDAQEKELQALLKEQQQRGSANFHKWLTPDEFGARFGVAEADIAKITKWLSSHGLEVESVSRSRMVITFTGTHQQLRSAFHTELRHYLVKEEDHLANANDPQIPTALYPVVSGITSLNNIGLRPLHTTPLLASKAKGGNWQISKDKVALQNSNPSSPLSGLTTGVHPQFNTDVPGDTYRLMGPGDFNIIYNVSPLWAQGIDGTGQRIAIVAQSDINPADVDSFRETFGLPPTKLNVIYVNESPGLTGDSIEGEAALDVQWAGAIAKNATIDLVVASSTPTAQGVMLAMQYAVDNNVAPILNVSWGGCELAMGVTGNEYTNALWQQAAAQGISVLVAAGDSGSATCDQGWYFSEFGEQVSGTASTPYNTAVGGTDFSVNLEHAEDYWNSENDPETLSSAKGYIPETPWNDTCASTQVLAAAQLVFGFPVRTTEALCNYFDEASGIYYPFTYTAGGGGGVSNCTVSDGHAEHCSGGYPAPEWQANLPGRPYDKRRLPDVSFFSGTGMWGTAYVFCQSDRTPNGTCNYATEDVLYLASGGTSFAAPAFAGMLALLNQKTESSQGNINPILYQLGVQQYNGTVSGIFHDITEGNNAQPCLPDSVAVPPSTLCTITDPSYIVGVLPEFNASEGYDMTSGLGSVDATRLADAWTSAVGALASTQTTLELVGESTVVYGTPVTMTVSVAPSDGSDVPTGSVAVLAGSQGMDFAELSAGTANLTVKGLVAGDHVLVGHYGGNGVFAPSTSTTVPVTVTKAATSLAITPSKLAVLPDENLSFKILVRTESMADSPTGAVVITNITTGTTVTAAVTTDPDAATGASFGSAFVTIQGPQLSDGNNDFEFSYSGDSNYLTCTGSQSISHTGPFSVTLTPASLTLSPAATTGNTITITLAPNQGAILDPTTISLQCPGTLPGGLACSFSTPEKNADGSITATLTVLQSGPLAQTHKSKSIYLAGLLAAGSFTGMFGICLLTLPKRRSRNTTSGAVLAVLGIAIVMMGCGGTTRSTPASSSVTTTELTASSVNPPLGSDVTFTASVKHVNGNGAPTGTVTFQSGANAIGTATLNGGSATFTTSSLPVGMQSVTATYGGDSTYSASTSATLQVDVTLTADITVKVADKSGNLAVQTLPVTVK